MNECMKCSGTGRINGFSHIVAGRCFACGGSGKASAKTHGAHDAAPAGRTWKFEACEVYLDTFGKYAVTSATGATVYVIDGEAFATDGVKKNKAAAERWAARLVSRLA